MKQAIRFFITFSIILNLFLSSLLADVYVRGYFRRNGTFVFPHFRSTPDSNIWNNWSTYPNINPYTGKQGTKYKYHFYYPVAPIEIDLIEIPVIPIPPLDLKIHVPKEIPSISLDYPKFRCIDPTELPPIRRLPSLSEEVPKPDSRDVPSTRKSRCVGPEALPYRPITLPKELLKEPSEPDIPYIAPPSPTLKVPPEPKPEKPVKPIKRAKPVRPFFIGIREIPRIPIPY